MRESKKFKIALSHLFLQLFYRGAKATVEKQAQLPDYEFRSILVYSTTALGDYMFNSPALRALRQRYPAAKIILVAHPKYEKLLTRRDFYDEVILWGNKVKDLGEMVKQARQHAPELAVLLHSHMPYDILSAAMSGCQFIVRDNYAKPMGKMAQWLVHGLDHYDDHVIARKMKLVAALGCSTDDVSMALPCDYPVQPKATGKVRIGFQLGASALIRCWPAEYYAELANRLVASNPEIEITLIGSPEETHLADSLLQHVNGLTADRIVSHVGKTTLPQLLGVIDSMNLLVTGDTGPLHLAIALHVPTLSLFVTENPRRSGPYQERHLHQQIYLPVTDPRVTDAEKPLRAISPDYVYEHVSHMLLKP